ncbi:heterokaryon incompatibility protein-domain-containing protein [Cladorrhinum sp. PSN259]|nr:heterokaryon incompatibility protein-domain-containing protein [Cladorrhinum sp. PSN259]
MSTLYSSLNGLSAPWFRLLTLHPAASSLEPIICNLAIHPLINGAECPPYEALSYCWGHPSTFYSHEITCNDIPIKISSNLCSAIKSLRLPDSPRILWIDQLCINQNDNGDKTDQVSRMGDIYSLAARTVVWLGEREEGDGSELVFALCDRFQKSGWCDIWTAVASSVGMYKLLTLDPEDRKQLIAETVAESEGTLQTVEPEDVTETEVEAAVKLVTRLYFSRSWVIQEICLSKEVLVVCGDQKTNWDLLRTTVSIGVVMSEYVVSHYMTPVAKIVLGTFPTFNSLSDSFPSLGSRDDEESAQGHNLDLLDCLWETRILEATEPRDKVFAFLGLQNQTHLPEDLRVVPNYHATVEDTFKSTARHLIAQRGNLDYLFTEPHLNPNPNLTLPSWAPDWSAQQKTRVAPLLEDLKATDDSSPQKIFNACGSCPTVSPIPPIDSDSDSLHLSGFIFDSIISLTPVAEYDPYQTSSLKDDETGFFSNLRAATTTLSNSAEYFSTLSEWESFALSSSSPPSTTTHPYPPDSDPLKIFATTIVARHMPGGEEESYSRYLSYRKGVLTRRSGHNKLKPVTKLLKIKERLPWLSTIGQAITATVDVLRLDDQGREFQTDLDKTYHRRLGRTKTGYLALVPGRTEVGNEIALFKGGKAPIVLRGRKGQDPNKWEIVGVCYVHGIMDGEAWDQERCEEIEIV